jgi:hypothetical protein
MKKQFIILFPSLSVLADCNQEPQRPSADKLNQKVQDKYDADLTAIKDFKKKCRVKRNNVSTSI